MSELTLGSISIKNVSKVFRKTTGSASTYTTLKSFLLKNLISSSKKESEKQISLNQKYKALDSVSIEFPAGSSTALIGRNGSGKSTILKLIAGIYTPDSGSISVKGKVSALIELGAGFHPDFTGRENIFLGGIMFGLSKKEIKSRFDKIVQYAELEHVIDEPVRTYSSGMYMRLGFSLAIHTKPDILLVDEVLAVGDAHFINRCQDSISEFKKDGKTLVFVTHDLSSVSKWCDEAIWLENGSIKQKGHPREISDAYLSSVHDKERKELEKINIQSEDISIDTLSGDSTSKVAQDNKRWGNFSVTIDSVNLLDKNMNPQTLFDKEDSIIVELQFSSQSLPSDLVFGIGVIRIDGLEVFGTNTSMKKDAETKLEKTIEINSLSNSMVKDGVIRCEINRIGLTEGSYFMNVAAHTKDGTPYDYHNEMHKFQIRNKENNSVGVISPLTTWDFSFSNIGLNIEGKKASL